MPLGLAIPLQNTNFQILVVDLIGRVDCIVRKSLGRVTPIYQPVLLCAKVIDTIIYPSGAIPKLDFAQIP